MHGKQDASGNVLEGTWQVLLVMRCWTPSESTLQDGRLSSMATRKPLPRNSHLEEAMALLIRNQAAFVEQIARNDQERLKLQINGEDCAGQRNGSARLRNGSARLRSDLIGLSSAWLVLKPVSFSYPKPSWLSCPKQ